MTQWLLPPSLSFTDDQLAKSAFLDQMELPADFWAAYISGACALLIGNPLDIVKVRLQSGEAAPPSSVLQDGRLKSLIRGLFPFLFLLLFFSFLSCHSVQR